MLLYSHVFTFNTHVYTHPPQPKGTHTHVYRGHETSPVLHTIDLHVVYGAILTCMHDFCVAKLNMHDFKGDFDLHTIDLLYLYRAILTGHMCIYVYI